MSKALHGSAEGIITDLGLIPGCVAAALPAEIHEAAHICPSVVRGREGFDRPGSPCPITL
jgi:hypothetical protein